MNDHADDANSKADGLRAGLAGVAAAGVMLGSFAATPAGATNMPTYDSANDTSNTLQIDSPEQVAPVDAAQESADSIMEFTGAVADDMKSRDEMIDVIESAPDLMPEASDNGEPPDTTSEASSLYSIDTTTAVDTEAAHGELDDISELEAAELAAGEGHQASDAEAVEMAALDNALADIDNSSEIDTALDGEFDAFDALADIADTTESDPDMAGDFGNDFGGEAGDAGDGGGDGDSGF